MALHLLLLLRNWTDNLTLCYPFLLYTLEISPGGGPLWLSCTWPEEAKEFPRFSFEESAFLNEDFAKAAGLSVVATKASDLVQAALEMTKRTNERSEKSPEFRT